MAKSTNSIDQENNLLDNSILFIDEMNPKNNNLFIGGEIKITFGGIDMTKDISVVTICSNCIRIKPAK